MGRPLSSSVFIGFSQGFKSFSIKKLVQKITMQSSLSQRLQFLTVEKQSTVFNNDLLINLKITAPEAPATRLPASIICVLDISGSMDTEATQGGAVESDGFSRLDLVKHSVNTIINCLSDDDALAIVTFSDNARVDLEPLKMNQVNKNKAMEVIGKMKTEGSTNLWDGIRLGLQLTKNQQCKEKNCFVVVLSDGEPNQHPPNGELAAATEYIKQHPMNASMSMFGYGYSLDTELLSALTELGGGCFGYIPDCSMIGTIFVNFLSAALASFSPKLQASLKLKNCELKQFNSQNTNYSNLGSIQYGTTRNCFIQFKGVPQEQDLGQIEIYFEQDGRERTVVKLDNKIAGDANNMKVQKMRVDHIRVLQKAIQKSKTNLKDAQDTVLQHLERMKNFQGSLQEKDERLALLIRDIESQNSQEGQVMIALTKQEYWSKWGIHYFPALKIAHANQMCTNFKDPGLKIYEGEMFKSLQNTFDTVFIHLTPPIPSIKKFDSQGNPIVVADMNSYYDQQGGCIHGDCEVMILGKGLMKVKQLQKGDCVQGPKDISVVKCVIETKVNSEIEMVKFPSGLIITKFHPVFIEERWQFPIDYTPAVKVYVESYYNFVMEQGHSIHVQGIDCVTFGHGLQEQVVKHAYFGTQDIIADLSRAQGWNNGHVQVIQFKRDPISMLVNGIVI